MAYDEDLLVELIACGDVTHSEIANRVGVSRRTVWQIANNQSRPDLQRKIADTVESYRQATIRMAARHMQKLLKKHIEVALEGDGETARKSREFLLKTFLTAPPPEPANKNKPKCESMNHTQPDGAPCRMKSLSDLPPDLKSQVAKALGAPRSEEDGAGDTPFSGRMERPPHPDAVGNAVSVPEKPPPDAPPRDPPDGERTEEESDYKEAKEETPEQKRAREAMELKKKGKMIDPFSNFVDGPHGTRTYAHSLELERQALAERAEMVERERRRNLRRRRPKK